MATDERKRQKALAKKKKREIQVRKESNKARNPSPQDLVKAMQRGSWNVCYEINDGEGVYNLICVRNSPMGPIGCSFLVDLYCLGIMDADALKSVDLSRLSEFVAEREGRTVTPAYVFKLLTFALEEAQKIGFTASRNALTLMPIFNDVDASNCDQTFTFGKDGKPFYIGSSDDSMLVHSEILEKLQKLGTGNFDYLIPISSQSRTTRIDADNRLQHEDDENGDLDDYDSGTTIDSTATIVDSNPKS